MKFAKGLQEIQIVLIKYNNTVYIMKVSKSSSVFSYIILLCLFLSSLFSGNRYFYGAYTFRKQKCFIQSVACIAGRVSGRVLLFFRGGATKDWEQLKIVFILSRSSATKKVPHA